MRKFVFFIVLLILCLKSTCYGESPNNEPKIIDLSLGSVCDSEGFELEGVILLSENGNLYFWEPKTYTPILYDTNVIKIDHNNELTYIKSDNTSYSIASRNNITPRTSKYVCEYYDEFLKQGFYIDKSRTLFLQNKDENKKIIEHVKNIKYHYNYSFVLCEDGTLWKVNEEIKELIMKNVKKFDVIYYNDMLFETYMYIINYSNDLIYKEFERYANNSLTIYLGKNISDVSLGYLNVLIMKKDGSCWEDVDHQHYFLKQVANNVVKIDCGVGTKYLIKNDGTVWYWGEVIGSKYFYGLSGNIEIQKQPQQLYWNDKMNQEVSQKRMKKILTQATPEMRKNLLKIDTELYIENYKECFTEQEIEKYATEYLKEQKHRSEA